MSFRVQITFNFNSVLKNLGKKLLIKHVPLNNKFIKIKPTENVVNRLIPTILNFIQKSKSS
jgi:hypothetical protein